MKVAAVNAMSFLIAYFSMKCPSGMQDIFSTFRQVQMNQIKFKSCEQQVAGWKIAMFYPSL